ncbi:MAG: TlpA family protein disulfide reductase [Alphaproteobacteria bacterium]|nr:TlpA family protein disulfide reductase [Alphaproteobacteria bacterium SS10]
MIGMTRSFGRRRPRRGYRFHFSHAIFFTLGLIGIGAIAIALLPVAAENIELPMPDGLDQFTLDYKGLPPPNAIIQATDGSTGQLTSFTGKIHLVNIWATWCPPCIVELPSLERLQTHFPREQFEVVAVSVDAEGWPAINRFHETHGLNLPVYLDMSGPVLSELEYFSLPTTILLDENGVEIGRQPGVAIWDSNRAIHLIERAIEGSL